MIIGALYKKYYYRNITESLEGKKQIQKKPTNEIVQRFLNMYSSKLLLHVWNV